MNSFINLSTRTLYVSDNITHTTDREREPDGSESASTLFSRRSVLRGLGVAGVAGPGLTAVSGGAVATGTVIGDFETGLDGWTTSGGNDLARVDRSAESAPVTRGESALAVTSADDPQPAIGKEIQTLDLTETPYLYADVLPESVAGTDSLVTFRFRYYSEVADEVIESPEISVRQRYGIRLVWDTSGLDERVRAAPTQLELAWYPADYPPKTGPRGRGPGFDYQGTTYVDNVRAGDDDERVELGRWRLKRRELRRERGFRANKTVDTLTDTVQEGIVTYTDGTELPYRGEILDDGTLELTIDGERFEFRGGS